MKKSILYTAFLGFAALFTACDEVSEGERYISLPQVETQAKCPFGRFYGTILFELSHSTCHDQQPEGTIRQLFDCCKCARYGRVRYYGGAISHYRRFDATGRKRLCS